MSDDRVLDISWGTIFKIFIAIIVFYVIYLTRDILIWFVFALIISVLFNPAIDFLQKRRIPRSVATVFVYVLIFGAFSFLMYSILSLTWKLFLDEISDFLAAFPQYFEKISPLLKGIGFQAFENIDSFIVSLGKTLEGLTTNIFSVLFAAFGGIFSTIFILTIAIFLSLEEKAVEKGLTLLFPKKQEAYILDLWDKCQRKVSGWFLSRVLGCVFVGLLSFITFLIFKVDYAFSLGLAAGVLNFIPIVGPILTGILILLVISFDWILKAIFVLVVYTLIQQIENNIVTPILTRKFIGLSPALVLLALAVGGTLWGFLGAILAIPLFGILFEFLRDFLKRKRDEQVNVIS